MKTKGCYPKAVIQSYKDLKRNSLIAQHHKKSSCFFQTKRVHITHKGMAFQTLATL